MVFSPSCLDSNWCCHGLGLIYMVILLRFHECSFPGILRRCNLSLEFLVLWLLKSFYSFFWGIPWDLGTRVITWTLMAHDQLLESFWPVVVFCNGSHLLQKRILWWVVRATLISGCKDKYSGCSSEFFRCRKVVVVGSPLRTKASLTMDDWIDFQC